MTAYLVDLASYQHGINLAALKAAGYTRVNIKLTQGSWYVNPYIAEFVDGARANGLDVCTFHWLDGRSSGAAQANYCLAQMDRFGLRYGTAHQVDCEDTEHPASWIIWRDYVNAMQNTLGRHVINYTGDWWWPAHMGGNNGAAITPYLWAAPNHGYDPAYPGDDSPDWQANYGGWGQYSALQFAVGPLSGVGGGDLSKTAFRDPHVWTALTGVDAASIEGDDMTSEQAAQLGQIYDWLSAESARIDAWTAGSDLARTGPYAGKEQQFVVTTLKNILAAQSTPAPVALSADDRAAIVAALKAELAPLIPTAADIAKATADEEARRLAD